MKAEVEGKVKEIAMPMFIISSQLNLNLNLNLLRVL